MHSNDHSAHIKVVRKADSVKINLPSSKSIANRALIINALSQNKGNLSRLSEARDTQTMERLLTDGGDTWDVLDAGTTMRFLTAFAAVNGLPKTLTGTRRMQERPIGILVDALRELGADIEYLGKLNFPPIRTGKFGKQKTNRLEVRGDISSQYISALMMIAPVLPEGLRITLTNKIGSRPYIDMTRAVMQKFGVASSWLNDHEIEIPHQQYIGTDYTIERDWSAASYWYAVMAISGEGNIVLNDLIDNSIQGDRVIADIMSSLGVKTVFTGEGALLSPSEAKESAEIDFSDCPDLAQTVAVVCAAKGIRCTMYGLESLRIKETDRIAALQNELSKIGGHLRETKENKEWVLEPGSGIPENAFTIDTYHDHRMAMAFAPLAWKFPVEIRDPDVVNKSYPGFWNDLAQAGAVITSIKD